MFGFHAFAEAPFAALADGTRPLSGSTRTVAFANAALTGAAALVGTGRVQMWATAVLSEPVTYITGTTWAQVFASASLAGSAALKGEARSTATASSGLAGTAALASSVHVIVRGQAPPTAFVAGQDRSITFPVSASLSGSAILQGSLRWGIVSSSASLLGSGYAPGRSFFNCVAAGQLSGTAALTGSATLTTWGTGIGIQLAFASTHDRIVLRAHGLATGSAALAGASFASLSASAELSGSAALFLAGRATIFACHGFGVAFTLIRPGVFIASEDITGFASAKYTISTRITHVCH